VSEGDGGVTIARHLLDVGRPQRALEVLEQLPNPDLDDPELWYLRAAALHDLERFAEAGDAARQGLAIDPHGVDLLVVLASAEAERGHLAEAETAMLAALELSPDHPTLLARYGLLVAQAGQLDKAERLVAEAGRLAPESPDVINARSIVAFLRGDDNEAAAHGRALLAQNPESLAGHLVLGSTASAAGRLGDADRHFRTAASLEPSDEYAEIARESGLAVHWLLLPLWPIARFGPAPVWLAGVGVIIVLGALGYGSAAAIAGVSWLAYCAYTWVIPPLLRRWLERRAL
jgi:Flp pilus assembly protein TadD